MDHLEVRFGREVIFDKDELHSNRLIVKPQPLEVEQILPVSARPRGLSDSALPRAAEELAAKNVHYHQYGKI